jgi:hypothetical protein
MKFFIKLFSISITLLILNLRIAHSQEYLQKGIIKLTKITNDKTYGYTEKNPIKVGSIDKGYHFLNALKGPMGEKISYERIGSCCPFKTKNALIGDQGLLGKYKIIYEGLEKSIILYINVYDKEELKCPYGLTFKTEKDL